MMSADRPTPVEPTALLVVKLEAQQWNIVMAGLGELQFKTSAPLVQALMEQLQAQTVGNGVDTTAVAQPTLEKRPN